MLIPTPEPGEWMDGPGAKWGTALVGTVVTLVPTLCPGTPAPLWRNSPLK